MLSTTFLNNIMPSCLPSSTLLGMLPEYIYSAFFVWARWNFLKLLLGIKKLAELILLLMYVCLCLVAPMI